MKLLRSLLVVLLLASVMSGVNPPAVHAAAADEKSLARVEKELDDLWNFVDSSGSVEDEAFYPQFVTRAKHAQDEIAKTEKELARTTETRGTKEAVERLREDVQQMQVALIAWRSAAEAKDTTGFEEASYLLSDIIDIYNEDVDSYNSAAHGARAMAQMALHISPLFVALAAVGVLFAIAFYRNNPSDDIIGEIHRQLRWHLWYASLFLLVIAAVPLYTYFFTASTLPVWGWWALSGGLLPTLYVLIRYIKVRRLARRP